MGRSVVYEAEHWSAHLKGRTVFGLLLITAAIAVGSALITYHSLTLLITAQDWVVHTDTVISDARGLASLLLAAERDTYTYVLTGREESLRRRDADFVRERTLADRLRRETRDNPVQTQRVAELNAVLEAEIAHLSDLANYRQRKADLTASDLLAADIAAQNSGQIEAQITKIVQEENRLLEVRKRSAMRIARETKLFIVFGAIPAVLLGEGLVLMILRQLRERERIRRELTKSNLMLNTLIDKAPIGIINIDADKIVRLWNPAATGIFGSKPEEVVGKRVEPDSALRAEQFQWLETQVFGLNVSREQRPWLRRDGSVVHVAFSAAPVEDEKGRSGVVLIAEDVTEKLAAAKRVEESTNLQRAMLESAGDGIYGVDMQGRTTFLNGTALDSLRYTEAELLGRDTHNLVHHTKADGTPYPIEECPIYNSFRRGTAARVEKELFFRKDGTSFPVDYVSTPIFVENEIVGAVVNFRDISERMAAEKAKSEFISLVSHELRTPLTSIRGSLGLLESGLMGDLSEEAMEMLQIGIANTDRLIRLINDILDLERIDSGQVKLKRQVVPVRGLTEQTLGTLSGAAQQAGIQLRCTATESKVFCDPDKIVQVLTNLIGNAIKFSPRGSEVLVSATQENGQVIFAVADQGRGVPGDKLESIFERFQQVDVSDAREKGGTGLGLPIAKSIVVQHGGRMWAESTLGQGSTFFFSVPIDASAESHMIPETDPDQATIMLCGPFGDDAKSLEDILRREGYKVIVTDSNDVAAELAAEHPNMIIFLVSGGPSREGDKATDRADEHVSAASDAAPPLVLLVEDDTDLAQVVQQTFVADTVRIHHIANGADAIRFCAETKPRLVLLDILLPDVDGFGVVAALRSQGGMERVPLVVYSAKELTNEEEKELRLGRTAYLTKSKVSPKELHDVINMLLATNTGLDEYAKSSAD